MKKQIKKLRLNSQTIREIASPELVLGGARGTTCTAYTLSNVASECATECVDCR